MSGIISIPELLKKKRDGDELTPEEINFFIQNVVTGNVQDCQTGAMLMAMYLNGLTDEETVSLTTAMVHSGDQLHWNPEWEEFLVDKHSTGGCGDKISLVLAPALAACGFKVPMISGRGLEHTGGTLDKLESIAGFRVQLSETEMKSALETAGCFIAGPTMTLAPGDKELYKRRDVTATVDSIPLVVASIISKKVAEGTKTLVMDVKVGSAAFFQSEDKARTLASMLIKVSSGLGVKTRAVLTRMNTPIGRAVGNSLEVAEAIECLKGNGPCDVVELVSTLGGIILEMKGHVKTLNDGKDTILNVLNSGEALEKFRLMLISQGVTEVIATTLCQGDMWSVLPSVSPNHITVIKAYSSGVITEVDALRVAKAAWKLGAGRSKADEPIDHKVGIRLLRVQGEKVKEGEGLMEVYHNSPELPVDIHKQLEEAIVISEKADKTVQSLIIDIITN
ncbi:hypothetical protein Cfor_03921 [Coptotermes formosanus]|uniref:Thymidine phosphorylase n=1 Tax=Coptotermes formosanus TaxID=36987 RepID=A0A6L2PTA9_COPFO|nr:hypothetical protein Cfor_03921 [Coptotermes formosanus]